MGTGHSSTINSIALLRKGNSTPNLDRIRPSRTTTSSSRTTTPSSRTTTPSTDRKGTMTSSTDRKEHSLAHSLVKRFSKLSGSVKNSRRERFQVFREMITTWPIEDVQRLLREWDSAVAVGELQVMADRARCPASTVADDLGRLFKSQVLADTQLFYRGTVFMVHSAILSIRSTFFFQLLKSSRLSQKKSRNDGVEIEDFSAHLLKSSRNDGVEIEKKKNDGVEIEDFSAHLLKSSRIFLKSPRNDGVEIEDFSAQLLNSSRIFLKSSRNDRVEIEELPIAVTVDQFRLFLFYVYTGQGRDGDEQLDSETLSALTHHFGCMNTFERDMQRMEQWALMHGDCRLQFISSSSSHSEEPNGILLDERSFTIRCCAPLLAARSPLLCAEIRRQSERMEKEGDEAKSERMEKEGDEAIRVVIDEKLMSRVYAELIIHAFYTDKLNLSKVMHGCQISANSLNEVQAIAAGRCQTSTLSRGIDIFNIARFLDLHRLAQGCEDLIVSEMTIDDIGWLYDWANGPGGSVFVRRGCVSMSRLEFYRLTSSSSFLDMDIGLLIDCFDSDFVQATEVELLDAAIRWGEQAIVRRMEEREPNLIAGTTHSISRRGVRRADLPQEELRSLLSPLLDRVRTDFILPPFHPNLLSAYSRGLLQRQPPIVRVNKSPEDELNPDAHWFRPHTGALPGPRLLFGHLSEARNMVKKKTIDLTSTAFHCSSTVSIGEISLNSTSSDVVSTEMCNEIQQKILKECTRSELFEKASMCTCSHHRTAALREICLRNIREAGLNEDFIKIEFPANGHGNFDLPDLMSL